MHALTAVATVGVLVAFAVFNLASLLELDLRRVRRRGPARHVEPGLDSSWIQPVGLPRRSRRAGFLAWFRWWRRHPRPALRVRDWFPRDGRVFIPFWAGVLLLIAGTQVLLGPHQTFRLGGLLAVLGSLPLLTLVVLYVLRPVARSSQRSSPER
jgi:hypothetical protein